MKIVIYGANEIGSMIATEFFEDHDIIVIDPDSQALESFSKLDIATYLGDATNLSVLKEADVCCADIFIACTSNDEANIVSCVMAKHIANIQTVCFVSKKECADSLRELRDDKKELKETIIDHVIWPEKLLTQEIFQIITVPEAIDVENFAHGKAKLLEYRIKENSILCNKLIKDCCFPDESLIVGIVRDEELFIPTGLTELKLNDKVIFMGTPEGLDITAAELFSQRNQIKHVAIIGGGSIGYELAKNLEKTSIKTKIIESDYERCEFLSENLKCTLVLHGNGTDIELLKQENVGECDVIICVTDSDEKNLLCSLLAKQIGSKRVVARVNKATTAILFEKVGVDIAVSVKEAATDEVKNRIIEEENKILASVERGLGEITEIEIKEDFKDTNLMDLKLPIKAIVAIVRRQTKVIIPKGQTLIRGGDRLIIFTKSQDADIVREYFKK